MIPNPWPWPWPWSDVNVKGRPSYLLYISLKCILYFIMCWNAVHIQTQARAHTQARALTTVAFRFMLSFFECTQSISHFLKNKNTKTDWFRHSRGQDKAGSKRQSCNRIGKFCCSLSELQSIALDCAIVMLRSKTRVQGYHAVPNYIIILF